LEIKTRQEYIDSLRRLNLVVYILGERVENFVDYPVIRPSVEHVAMTYELVKKLENKEF
jgi:4-hydroxybutyryl-CoA dehydratase/vinylacetyl-CoA-Delta-isomerase